MPDPLPVIRCNCLLFNFITIIFAFLPCLLYHHVNAQVLNPPYFNLAEGRNISATATCGEGVPEPELYCKLVGAYWLEKHDNVPVNLIQGQACDYCTPGSHPAEYAIDGTERWWQSPPLSRGMKYNEVNVTIDLGQEFNVAYVFIKMANSPRPGIWSLERSRDYGKAYYPWQHFADTEGDCIAYFGHASLNKIVDVDSVICETKFSKVVPLEGGEIVVSLLNDRPGADNFSTSAELQEWTTATNIRLRLLRPKTTLGHLISVAKQDPTITRRYFYSIKDINIGGRCVCNGHANQCDQINPSDPYKLLCRCQHNTCGAQCGECCPGYRQHKWKRATVDNPNSCEKCNCFGHSDDCNYDEEVEKKRLSLDINGKYNGGGVCVNCQHNTEGINCDKCKSGFYRPRNRPLDSPNVCVPCQCDLNYSTGNCTEGNGLCECKKNFKPPYCNECNYGYFGYPHCIECHCFPNGTFGNVCQLETGECPCRDAYAGKYCKQCSEGHYGFPNCHNCECHRDFSISNICNIETGECDCKDGYGGRKCDSCAVGYYNYPRCDPCTCDPIGTVDAVCNNETGKCYCKEGYAGERCDYCEDGYFGYPNCTKCNCDEKGSLRKTCDIYGRCTCNHNFGGPKCSDCSPGYYKPKQCLPCVCTQPGSNGLTCDINGRCICHDRFEGDKCDKCKEGYYNYPRCEECNCNPAGLIAQFGGCDKVQEGKLCECKERVTGRICNKCKDLFWNLNINNPLGCEDCLCDRKGTISGLGTCDGISGQCSCKSKVIGRQCSFCKDDTYSLSDNNLFGCLDCGCDFGGAIHAACDKKTGQCYCKPRIRGRRCTEPIELTYFPTLYQFQYEIEDWRNPTGSPARFGYDDSVFTNYSWRGYAAFTDLQRGVMTNITIQKPSLYRPIFRFVNLNREPITGTLTFTPVDSIGETQQSSTVIFEPTNEPKLLLAASKPGLPIVPYVLNPGLWGVSLKVDKNDLLLDYMVLIPQSYYEPNIFQDKVNEPCKLSDDNLCRHYSYPKFSEESGFVRGSAAFVPDGSEREKINVFEDENIIQKLQVDGNLAWINQNDSRFVVDVSVKKPGLYAFVVLYHNPNSDLFLGNKTSQILTIDASTAQNEQHLGTIVFPDCPYSFVCRQLITDERGEISIVELKDNYVQLHFKVEQLLANELGLAVDTIVAVPFDPNTWSLDLVTPGFVCVRRNGKCIDSSFAFVPEATKIEIEKDNDKVTDKFPFSVEENKDLSLPKLILLDKKDLMVDVKGKVSHSGLYNVIVHYYQPDYSRMDIDVTIQNGQFHTGILPVKHCPNRNGCRAVIKQRDENSTLFQIYEDFMLTLKQPEDKTIWIDYVLIVPAEHFDPDILSLKKQDKISDFLSQCAKNTFHINSDEASDFCRSSIFSLTVDYNGGALPCQCNSDGSLDYRCKAFGGQCNCKPNVIGRTCSRCRTGYYGFPNCRLCDCPSTAVCHQITGECICPKGVTGDKCDRCLNYTFGFDKILGCEDCDCHQYGARNRDLQCDVITGQCNCKVNVVGRTCNKCKPGFWSHPFCQLCRCDIRGTTEDICDQTTSRCFCKANVYGEYCDTCKPDAYNLEENNPLGCTKCFCFGTTDRCTSSTYKLIQTSEMENGWRATSLIFSDNNVMESFINSEDVNLEYSAGRIKINQPANLENSLGTSLIVYFSAPKDYLGNRVTSYGGILKYSIENVIIKNGGKDVTGLVAADLVLKGNNITLVHEHIEQPNMVEPFELSSRLIEREFRHLNGFEVSREQMMMVLVNLEAIYIRGTYFEPISSIYLRNVLLDRAIEGRRLADAPRALAVEQCNCPSNYQGTSCEQCGPGSYRAKTGPYLGFCLPCQCNGHSNECDPVTGVCFNCQHNTQGDHCEKCISGYHGNATRGTPYDCLICACPLPIASNNFATSCEVSSNGLEVQCQCKHGYYGDRCDICAAGYFGRPEIPGQSCQPCNCSGNIDVTNRGSCESTTGECMLCLHNSFGRACEYCRPGYYGDSVLRKNCSACSCDECGSEQCNHYTGLCSCRQNVVGKDCDRCERDHWDFKSCRGCRPCECGIASNDTSCDDLTGQCKCRYGVTGRTCDRCEAGFWQYTKYGCTSCNCVEKYSFGAVCNQNTGQCQCLPGVDGEKCDRCPYRWVFIPKTGCRECGPCVHVLLDDTDALAVLIDPLTTDLQESSTTVFAYRRLNHVNKTYLSMEERIERMKENPKLIDLGPVGATAKKLDEDVTSLQSKSESLLKEGSKLVVGADSQQRDAIVVEVLIRNTIQKSNGVIEDIKQLEESFRLSRPNVEENNERRIVEMQYILDELNRTSAEKEENISRTEIQAANELRVRSQQFKEPALSNKDQINGTQINVVRIVKLLSELMNLSQNALKTGLKAEELNQLSLNRQLDKNIILMNANFEASNTSITRAQKHLEDGRKSITTYESLIIDLFQLTGRLKTDSDKVKTITPQLKDKYINGKPFAKDASEHARKLEIESRELERVFASTRLSATEPMKAANAYNVIVESLENASRTAEQTVNTGQKALDTVQNGEVNERKGKSIELQSQAKQLELKLQNDLNRVHENKKSVVNEKNNQITIAKTNHSLISQELEKLPQLLSLNELGKQASQTALNVEEKLKRFNDDVSKTFDEIKELKKRNEKLPKDIDAVNSAIKTGQNYAEKTITKIQKINMEEVKKRHEKLRKVKDSLAENISDLKRKIDLLRSKANRIKVGAEFYSNSTLHLQNPEGLSSRFGTSTKFSLFFRTKERNAFLAYIGNPVSITSKTKQKRSEEKSASLKKENFKDYMALEIIGGNINLHVDLGAGNTTITNSIFVSDGEWHQIILERIGKHITLTVRTQGKTDAVAEGSALGPTSVFNLDNYFSAIFIGGIPDYVKVQDEIHNRRFTGSIEEAMLGDIPLGLWNYIEQENVYGIKERDSLVNLAPPDVFWFDGHGYIILPRHRLNFTSYNYVQMKFKTFAKEGLLFLIGYDTEFFALELREGRIALKYELGSAPYCLESNQTYNDGRWHVVEANRVEKEGLLMIDTVNVAHGESIGRSTDLTTTDLIYIGGHPKEHQFYNVTNKDFEGCIKDLQIATEVQNLNKNIEAFRVVPGCPNTGIRTASFSNGSTGYITINTQINMNSPMPVALTFKTISLRGLLFYLATEDHSSYLTVYIDNGELVFRAHPGGVVRTTHKVKYNDNQWHYIIANFTQNRMKLDVDDINSFTIETNEQTSHSGEAKMIYFGGVPSDVSLLSLAFIEAQAPTSYVGCLGDATISEKVQNFAESQDRPNASLTTCPLTDDNNSYINTIDEEDDLTEILKQTEKPSSGVTDKPSTEFSITPHPPPIGQCKLSPVPFRDTDISEKNGLRFGNTQWSRHEFILTTADSAALNDESAFQIEFKTNLAEGVIFYVTQNNHIDFVSLYLVDGKVHYGWNCGSGKALVVSSLSYSDGRWHKVSFSRKGPNGVLKIDDAEQVFGNSNGTSNSLNVKSPIYIGGLPEQITKFAKDNLRGNDKSGALQFVTTSFPGCLRDLYVQGRKFEFSIVSTGYDVIPCSENVEDGSFFHSDGGHIKLQDDFRVGTNFDLEIQIKPRTISGVLLAVFGSTDYLILYVNDGDLTFSVDNGAGPINITFHPRNKYYFCDGEWHTIRATKINNLATLLVDDNNLEPGIGVGGVSSTDTRDPLYIGGLPNDIKNSKGVIKDNFVGCMRILQMNKRRQSFNQAKIYDHVTLNSCSTL